MKRMIFILILAISIQIVFASSYVSSNIPENVKENDYFNMTINIKTTSEKIDIVEFLPIDWQITDWSISPKLNVEFTSQAQIFLGKEREMNHWKFNSARDEITVKMKILAKEKGNYEFITLWMTPDGFDKISDKLNVIEKTKSSSPTAITGFAVKDLPDKEINQTVKTNNIERIINNLSEIKNLALNIPY